MSKVFEELPLELLVRTEKIIHDHDVSSVLIDAQPTYFEPWKQARSFFAGLHCDLCMM